MSNSVFMDAVRTWMATERRAARLSKELSDAYEQRDDAANVLGKLIAPRDIQVDEVISVWVRTGPKEERLVTVRLIEGETRAPRYEVSFRETRRE